MRDRLVLCYHAVSATWPAPLSVRPEAFRRQLAYLRRSGYRGVTFERMVLDPPRGRAVAITFDDAFRSVLELAAPILDDAGYPATVFVPTSFADEPRPLEWPGIDRWRGGPFDGELTPLSWDDLRALAERGWEIGSHTATHPRLTELGDDALAAELEGSRAACERALDRPCTTIAYPYGDVDGRVTAAARDAGYVAGAALYSVWHTTDALEFPRVGVWHDDALARFALKASWFRRRGLSLRSARAHP